MTTAVADGAFTPPEVERRGLLVSIVVTLVVGVLGIAWGIVSGSQMILLDGVYAFVGIVMSGLLLRASALADAGPTRRYPFGREAATPLVIGIQGFVLLATLLYALVEAVFTIVDGGSEVSAGVAIAYATIATISSVVVWIWLTRIAGTSDLLVAETKAWRVASFRGIGMLVGFIALVVIDGSRWDRAAPYLDPAMVILTCVAFLGTPIGMVRGTVIELLEGAPEADRQAPVRAIVDEVLGSTGIREVEVRMTKVGPKLYVEVDGRVPATVTVGDEHRVRNELEVALRRLPYEIWLNFELFPDVVAPTGD
jgi:cation diffusion facilitator family transporter